MIRGKLTKRSSHLALTSRVELAVPEGLVVEHVLAVREHGIARGAAVNTDRGLGSEESGGAEREGHESGEVLHLEIEVSWVEGCCCC